ncbi:MAG: glycosyltransferase family 39 protein, partial [Verrucomicrobia bacterium]|nr:glycosyltransferase family 39 protein [Verrucomicrobiota bacterium]
MLNPTLCGRVVAVVLGLLYVARVSPHWKIGRDSSLYLGLAQSLAEGRGFRFLDTPIEHPPAGLSLMLSLVWRTLGPNFLVMNALIAAMALATLWLVYRSVREIAGPWWALVVVVLTGLSQRMMQFSGQLMTDLPAMFGFWLAFYFVQRLAMRPKATWPDAAGAAVGLLVATAFRYSSAFAAPAFALVPWLRRRAAGPGFIKRLALSAAVVLPLAVSLQLWLHHRVEARPGEVVTSFYEPTGPRALLELMAAQSPRAVLFLDAAFESLTTQGTGADVLLTPSRRFVARDLRHVALLALIAVWLGAGAWQVSRKDRGLGVLATACYGGGVIVFGFESNPRYLLPVLPLLWWFAAEGLQAAWRAVRRRPAAVQPPGFPLGAPVAVAMALLLVPNVSKVLGEVRLAHASDFYAVYDHGHWKPYVAVAGWIKTNALPDARVLSVEGSPLGFLAGRPVVMNAAQCRPGDLLV